MDVAPPALSTVPPLDAVLAAAQVEFEEHPVTRMLVFLPDAIGTALCRDFQSELALVEMETQVRVELRSMVPAKTPVCFASMFTGALPDAHGIRRYERPVLVCDTLFDALARAGRRVAIVAVRESSMDTIFRNRDIDYYSEDDDSAVESRASGLIEQDRHDLVVAYQQAYDDCLHRTSHRSPEALAAFRRHLADFNSLAFMAGMFWGRHDHALLFAPDHGAHDDAAGRGTHGDNIPDDMEVTHFWGLRAESRLRRERLMQRLGESRLRSARLRAAGLMPAHPVRDRQLPGDRPMKILFLGDSLTEGTVGSGFIPFLDDFIPHHNHDYVNLGANGDTIGGLRRRAEALDQSVRGDAAFVWIGTNDVLMHPDWQDNAEQAEADYAALLAAVKPRVRRLWSVAPLIASQARAAEFKHALDRSAEMMRRVAEGAGATWVDLAPVFSEQPEHDYTIDGAHLGPDGARLVAGWLIGLIDNFACGGPA